MMTKPIFSSYLTAPWKRKYVEEKKDPHQCVFCSITNRIANLDRWEIFRDDRVAITLNKFPYNPGHILVFPLAHYEEIENLPEDLVFHLSLLIQRSIKVLKISHQPLGFNIGLNIGSFSGASVSHIHWHIVPRYMGDLNFMEILETRVLVETLEDTFNKLIQYNDMFQVKRSIL
ncbi:MAG: HIT domain-containing protein [Candidatus Heimdallarchaeota archaeon]|nr:HIT domain-containing protein [Candidatus Heimdallarchaeota archaeon]